MMMTRRKCEFKPRLQCSDKMSEVCVSVPVTNVTKTTVSVPDTSCSTLLSTQCQPLQSVVCRPRSLKQCIMIPATSCSHQARIIL